MDGTGRKNEREQPDAQFRDRGTQAGGGLKWLQERRRQNAGLGSLNALFELCQQEMPRRTSRALPVCLSVSADLGVVFLLLVV